jgi:hypothetical protein
MQAEHMKASSGDNSQETRAALAKKVAQYFAQAMG